MGSPKTICTSPRSPPSGRSKPLMAVSSSSQRSVQLAAGVAFACAHACSHAETTAGSRSCQSERSGAVSVSCISPMHAHMTSTSVSVHFPKKESQ